MLKASFMTEVCTELAITKNLATTDTFLCHDEGDVILSTLMVLMITVEQLVDKVSILKMQPYPCVSFSVKHDLIEASKYKGKILTHRPLHYRP
jgi:hypothetical protein